MVCKVQTDAYRRTVQNGVVERCYRMYASLKRDDFLWGIVAQKTTQTKGKRARQEKRLGFLSSEKLSSGLFNKKKARGNAQRIEKKKRKKEKGLGDPSPIYFLGLLAGGRGCRTGEAA